MNKTLLCMFVCASLFLSGCAQQTNVMPSPSASVQAHLDDKLTIRGEGVCLEHKNPGDAHTTECAYGIKTADGKSYSVVFTPETVDLFEIGKTYTIVAVFSENTASIYDIDGVLTVREIKQ